MADSNKTRLRKKKEQQLNKEAFYEIVGNPSSDVDGIYFTIQQRSSMGTIEAKIGQMTETANPLKPSISDFICDVENAIEDVCDNAISLAQFYSTFGSPGKRPPFSKMEKNQIIQKVGKLLRMRGISPVKRYFTVNVKRRNE